MFFDLYMPPKFGEIIPNLTSIFFGWGNVPPTRNIIESLSFCWKELCWKKTHVYDRISLLNSVMEPWFVAMEELVNYILNYILSVGDLLFGIMKLPINTIHVNTRIRIHGCYLQRERWFPGWPREGRLLPEGSMETRRRWPLLIHRPASLDSIIDGNHPWSYLFIFQYSVNYPSWSNFG